MKTLMRILRNKGFIGVPSNFKDSHFQKLFEKNEISKIYAYLYISVLWLIHRNLKSSSAFHHTIWIIRIIVIRRSIRLLDNRNIHPLNLKKILLVLYQIQSLLRIGQSEKKKLIISILKTVIN